MKQTLYDVLGVTPDASIEVVKAAYQERFEQLGLQTSTDSSRFVLLNEAREVLFDPVRRSDYDASLAAPPTEPHVHVLDDDEPRAYGRWIIISALVLVIGAWWMTRGDGVTDEAVEVSPMQAAEQSDRTLPAGEEDEPVEDEEVAPASATLAGASATTTALVPQDEETVAATATDEPGASVSPVVGDWQCFEPVTGRTSSYGFSDGGQLSVHQAGGNAQDFKYAMSGTQIKLTEPGPSQTMTIEELSEAKMILNVAGEGRRLVCSR